MLYTDLLDAIVSYDTIVISRHEHPDGDAFGSQFGLKTWIQDNFPEKKVYALGKDLSTDAYYPLSDFCEDAEFEHALGITVDCSDTKRLDDKRTLTCKTVIKIDHHPNNEPYGTINIVDDNTASCTQLLTRIFRTFEDMTISKKCAEYLYRGLLTDSMCYKTGSTTPETLEQGAYLTSKGLDIPLINRELFDKTLDEFKIINYLRNHVTIVKDHFAYIYLTLDELKTLGINGDKSREYVSEIGAIREFYIWAIFNERKTEGNLYVDASLRSKTITINIIANKYRGGGHKCASGIKGMSFEEYNMILKDLENALND